MNRDFGRVVCTEISVYQDLVYSMTDKDGGDDITNNNSKNSKNKPKMFLTHKSIDVILVNNIYSILNISSDKLIYYLKEKL